MNVDIVRNVQVRETIEIEFPFYYKQDMLLDQADCVAYGKIEENRHTVIHIRNYYHGQRSFEIEVEERGVAGLGDYLTKEFKSSEAEFLGARATLLAAVQNT